MRIHHCLHFVTFFRTTFGRFDDDAPRAAATFAGSLGASGILPDEVMIRFSGSTGGGGGRTTEEASSSSSLSTSESPPGPEKFSFNEFLIYYARDSLTQEEAVLIQVWPRAVR